MRVGFLGLLQILFIGLKLTGHIDWSWVLVLAPTWAPIVFWCGVILLIGLTEWSQHKRDLRSISGRSENLP